MGDAYILWFVCFFLFVCFFTINVHPIFKQAIQFLYYLGLNHVFNIGLCGLFLLNYLDILKHHEQGELGQVGV